jgi:arsenate reductase
MDFVLTVCDQAAGELCPLWPGQPVTAHWGMADPAAVEGSGEVREQAFRDASITIRKRLELMLALPVDSLDAPGLHKEVRDIGRR